MLNDYQILVVRRAMAAAVDKDAEIKRIAKGMKVEESEIQQALAQTPRVESAVSTNLEPSGRLVWGTKQLEQLYRLRTEGKGPAEIARIMGLKTHQVQSKLHSEKKSRSAAKSSVPAEEPVFEDDPRLLLLGPPPKPEPETCELESPSVTEEPSVIPKDDPDSFSFQAAAPAKRPFFFAVELTGLMRNLEYSHPPVEMGYLEANQTAGWATCHFKAAGENYIISLRREDSKS
ncbi:hypothetical protein [Faecalispora anaeroviscerum]|uniref:hypothetical protein n=1 Tax=Faecalispora anaeroviscerum TaxID=2991836 RepID=UPI0024BB1E85|nr:hypothetical protein [Faecalispora anaeroviscerum]